MTLPEKQEFQWQLSVDVVNGNKNVKENTRKKVLRLLIALTIVPMQLLVVWQADVQQPLIVVIPKYHKHLFWLLKRCVLCRDVQVQHRSR